MKVLELAYREAFELGHREPFQLGRPYIATGHMLLGLVRDGAGGAARVLANLGTDLNGVRHVVIQLLPPQG